MCSSPGDPEQYSTVWKVFLLLEKQRNPLQTDLVTICDFFTAQFENSNKALWERIFGRGCNMLMIRLTCLIAAKQLSSYPTRENESFTLLLC